MSYSLGCSRTGIPLDITGRNSLFPCREFFRNSWRIRKSIWDIPAETAWKISVRNSEEILVGITEGIPEVITGSFPTGIPWGNLEQFSKVRISGKTSREPPWEIPVGNRGEIFGGINGGITACIQNRNSKRNCWWILLKNSPGIPPGIRDGILLEICAVLEFFW